MRCGDCGNEWRSERAQTAAVAADAAADECADRLGRCCIKWFAQPNQTMQSSTRFPFVLTSAGR